MDTDVDLATVTHKLVLCAAVLRCAMMYCAGRLAGVMFCYIVLCAATQLARLTVCGIWMGKSR